jgi:predicted nucleic acid-binding protein
VTYLVVDASVIAKWVLSGEPYEENALRLKEDAVNESVVLHSPDLLRYELGNLFWKARKKSRISSNNATKALEILATMNINLHRETWQETIDALRIANELNLTVYDALYLRLGKVLEAFVLTADEKMWKTGKEEKYDLMHLKDY